MPNYYEEYENLARYITARYGIPVKVVFNSDEVLTKDLPEGRYTIEWMEEDLPPTKPRMLESWLRRIGETLAKCDHVVMNLAVGQTFCFKKIR